MTSNCASNPCNRSWCKSASGTRSSSPAKEADFIRDAVRSASSISLALQREEVVVGECYTNKLVMLYHRVRLAELGVRLPTLAEASSAVSGQYAIFSGIRPKAKNRVNERLKARVGSNWPGLCYRICCLGVCVVELWFCLVSCWWWRGFMVLRK